MAIIYTEDGLLVIPFSYKRLLELCDEPQGTVDIKFLPFGHCNKQWIDNKREYENIVSEHIEEMDKNDTGGQDMRSRFERFACRSRPSQYQVLSAELESKIRAALYTRFHGCPDAPGPVHQPDLTANNWISWVMWRLMKHGDDPDVMDEEI